MKDFLSIRDFSPRQLERLITNAQKLKTERSKQKTESADVLAGKSLAMIFDKASLRTRLSFEVGMTQLGGHAVYLAPNDIKLGVRESVEDSARVIGSMADGIVARISSHADLVVFADNSKIPVINAMTDQEHPCQVLADLLTIFEEFGRLADITVAYLGDADNNVTNSLALATHALKMPLRIATPLEFQLSPNYISSQADIKLFTDPVAAVKGADVVITDTWVSMGKEAEATKRLQLLAPFQVTPKLMQAARPGAIFMHCLPAYRGKEVETAVIDGPQSRVFQEAENRLHAQKAVLTLLLG